MPSGVVSITSVGAGEESDQPPSRDKATAREAEAGSVGLPVGVLIVGRHWREDVVLAAMAAVEETARAELRARPQARQRVVA